MPHVAIGSDDHKFVGNERISVKLALVPILGNVIFPFHLSGLLVESADLAVARTYDKEITHDRGRREYSTAGVKFPAYFR
jgi:hypothetical protein